MLLSFQICGNLLQQQQETNTLGLAGRGRACQGEAVEQEGSERGISAARQGKERACEQRPARGAQPVTSALASHNCPGIRTPVSSGLHASLGQKGIPV